MLGTNLSLTLVILASVVAVSFAAWSSPRLMNALVLAPVRVARHGEIWRLLTSAWLHADGGHLLVNMITLYFFGGRVEGLLGPVRFLIFYFSAAIVANIPSTLRHLSDRGYATLGASGAVSAVTLAAVLFHPETRIYLMFVPIPIPGLLYALGYLAYSAVQARRGQSRVNHEAHFAGALYGALLAFVFEPARVTNAFASFRFF